MLQNMRKKNAKGFTLIELMIVVAILAILSVVAVPAFIQYMRKAKTSEAVDMLDKIYKGASDYFSTPRVERTGDHAKLPCQFPADQGITPVDANCCKASVDSDDDSRCDSNPDVWTEPTWSALKFQITDQHYFVYQFQQTGEGSSAAFTASAYADLDCDSAMSTFERYGAGDERGGDCTVKTAAALFTENETE